MNQEFLSLLSQEIKQGYIRVATHPNLPLKIYNYTHKAQYEGHWDNVTLKCRGLILDNDGKTVVLPPQKFFNIGEPLASSIDLSKAQLTAKYDGYMQIVKLDSRYGLIISSRGGFNNQYTDATRNLLSKDILYKLKPDYSYFLELLQDFPGDENIIVTKHPTPQIVCWAIRDPNFNEQDFTDCPFQTAQVFSLNKAETYLEQQVEGIVAKDPITNTRVKIKTDWFINQHRLISNCTKKRVYEVLLEGKTVEDYDFPDELYPQMKNWQDDLLSKVADRYREIGTRLGQSANLTNKELGKLDMPDKKYLFTIRKQIFNTLLKEVYSVQL